MKHPQTQSHSASARSATAAVLAALLATGPVLAQVPAPSTATVTNAPAATTTPAAIDPELIRQLLLRIEQLEQREAARTNAVNDEVNRKLQQRIAELEQKLGAIEAGGKVLPEIAVTANDAPTTVELDRKLKDLEEKTAAESEAARVKAAKTPIVSLGSTGIRFSSAETNFTVTLKGLIQTDSHTYFSDNELREGNDTFGIRRARLYIRGTVYRDISFEIIPQWQRFFGGLPFDIAAVISSGNANSCGQSVD